MVARQGRAPPEHGREVADDSQFVTALARGLQVLEVCAQAGRPLGNGEIAEATGLSAPTVSRVTYTLYTLGYLHFLPRERFYAPGARSAGLAATVLRNLDLRSLARPEMEALARDAHYNVGLGTLDGDLMVYVDAFEGDALIGLRLRAGSHIPVLTSAMGRAYLAALDASARTAILDRLRPRYGDEWPMVLAGIRQAEEDIAVRGYCISLGEWQKEINGIAAPLVEPGTGAVYAINLGGPAFSLSEAMLRETLAPRLLATAERLRAQLGQR
jgi:DNA-binding IclR family transcriptional regulator